MFGQKLRDAERGFLERFESDQHGLLFRATPTSAPVRVTPAEREEERRRFVWRVRLLGWGFLAAMVLAVAAIVLLLPAEQPVAEAVIWGVILGGIAVFMIGWHRAWTAPAGRFARRAPAGAGRSREEARSLALRNMTWLDLGIASVLSTVLIARYLEGDRILPAVGAIMLAGAVTQALRKLAAGRDHPI